MNNIKLLPKLLGAFLLVSVLVVPVGYLGLTGTAQVADLLNSAVTNRLPAAACILHLELAAAEITAGENALLVKGLTDQNRADAYARFYDAEQSATNARISG